MKTNLERATEAMQAHLANTIHVGSNLGHAEHDFDAGDFLPVEQLCTRNADVAAIASHDAAKFHGEGR